MTSTGIRAQCFMENQKKPHTSCLRGERGTYLITRLLARSEESLKAHRIVSFLIAIRGWGLFCCLTPALPLDGVALFRTPTASSLHSGQLFKPYDWVVRLMLGWVEDTRRQKEQGSNRIRTGNKGKVGT